MASGVSESAEARARDIVEELGVSGSVRLATELVSEALGLITDEPDRLDPKIATAALAEMRDAYEMFNPTRTSARSRSSVRLGSSRMIRSKRKPETWPRHWLTEDG